MGWLALGTARFPGKWNGLWLVGEGRTVEHTAPGSSTNYSCLCLSSRYPLPPDLL